MLIATYRISDVVMGIMANPFYQDIGFTKEQVAAVSKVFGVVMTLLGAFIGGAATMRYGVLKMLMLGAVLFGYTVRPIQFPYAASAEISCWVFRYCG